MGFFEDVGSFFSGIFGKAESTVTTLYHDGTDAISGVFHAVDDGFEHILNNGGKIIDATKDVVMDTVDKTSESINHLGDNTQEIVKSAGDNVAKLGDSLSMPLMIAGGLGLLFLMKK